MLAHGRGGSRGLRPFRRGLVPKAHRKQAQNGGSAAGNPETLPNANIFIDFDIFRSIP